MKLYRKLVGDEALQSALAGTIKTLETGRGLAELAPVPGLPVVLDVLIAILEKVQVCGMVLLSASRPILIVLCRTPSQMATP